MTDVTSEAQDAADLAYLLGQSRIAGVFSDRVKAAEERVGVLAKYTRYEADGDDWEIGADELADAITGAETALSALRGVRRIADLYAARIAADLKTAEAGRR